MGNSGKIQERKLVNPLFQNLLSGVQARSEDWKDAEPPQVALPRRAETNAMWLDVFNTSDLWR